MEHPSSFHQRLMGCICQPSLLHTLWAGGLCLKGAVQASVCWAMPLSTSKSCNQNNFQQSTRLQGSAPTGVQTCSTCSCLKDVSQSTAGSWNTAAEKSPAYLDGYKCSLLLTAIPSAASIPLRISDVSELYLEKCTGIKFRRLLQNTAI